MTLNLLIAGGIATQVIFVGGNFAISAIALPALRQRTVPVSVQLEIFASIYHNGKMLLAGNALLGSLLYGAAALLYPQVRSVMLLSSALALAPIPFTPAFILPIVDELEQLRHIPLEDKESKAAYIDKTLGKWNARSAVRGAISGAGLLFTVYFVFSHFEI
jgi:hypothetical protein